MLNFFPIGINILIALTLLSWPIYYVLFYIWTIMPGDTKRQPKPAFFVSLFWTFKTFLWGIVVVFLISLILFIIEIIKGTAF